MTNKEIANKIMSEASFSEPPFPMRKVTEIALKIKEALDLKDGYKERHGQLK